MTAYYKVSNAWQIVTTPYLKVSGAWQPANAMYQKIGGVWTLVYNGDVTPPGTVPAIAIVAANADSPYRWQLSVQKPADLDVANILFAAKTGSYPTSPTDHTGSIINNSVALGNNAPLSTFAFDATTISNSTTTYIGDWVPSGGAVANVQYYFSFWAQDTSGNISALAKSATIVFPAKIISSAAYISPAYSASWAPQYGAWRDSFSPPEYEVYQGGTGAHVGMWFYGQNGVNVLKGKTITKMQIFVYRVNTTHGVGGAANVHLIDQGYFTKPSGAPSAYTGLGLVGTLNRGQGKWFNVPNTGNVWQAFANGLGNAKGFGLYTSNVGTTSADYCIAAGYNAGVSSGKIYVEYHT